MYVVNHHSCQIVLCETNAILLHVSWSKLTSRNGTVIANSLPNRTWQALMDVHYPSCVQWICILWACEDYSQLYVEKCQFFCVFLFLNKCHFANSLSLSFKFGLNHVIKFCKDKLLNYFLIETGQKVFWKKLVNEVKQICWYKRAQQKVNNHK